jgi:signal transduction histidine kinase
MSWDRVELGRTEAWIRGLGVAIWVFVGLSRLLPAMADAPATWLGVWLAYGAAFVLASFHRRIKLPLAIAALVVQAAAVVAMPHVGFAGFEGLLMSIVAVQVPMILSLRTGMVWALAQVPFLLGTVASTKQAMELLEILGAYATFTAFAFLVYWLHGAELRAQRELLRAHAELLSTRALVLEGVRQAERLRISRELHDSLGHQLTAVSIQLEVAQQVSVGEAVDPIVRAREVAKQALAELRTTITQMQRDDLNFVASVRALAAAIPKPRIHVTADDALRIDDREIAHTLFRCIQEALTNSLRHARARTISIAVAREAGGIAVEVRDDGTGSGADGRGAGTGLRGIQTRVSQIGGTVEHGSGREGGFHVRITVPLAEAAP